jgi:hypothetical protein
MIFVIAIVLYQREWAEAKKELQEERENVRRLALDRDQTMKNSLRQVEDMGKELTNALGALASAESRAAVAEVSFWLLIFVCFIFIINCSSCKEKHWSFMYRQNSQVFRNKWVLQMGRFVFIIIVVNIFLPSFSYSNVLDHFVFFQVPFV